MFLMKMKAKKILVLFFTSLFFFYGFGLNNMFNALGGDLMDTYDLSPLGLGWVSSFYFWANVLALIPMAVSCDRLSPKWMILGSLILSVFTVFAIAVSSQLWILVLARILMGVAGGCIFVGCIRIAVNWFDLKYMARMTGFIVTMGMLGGFMVQSPLISLINFIGWRFSLLIVAAIGVVISLGIFFFVSDHPEDLNKKSKELNKLQEAESGKAESIMSNLKLALKNPQNWLAGLAGSLNDLPIFLLGALWGVPYLMYAENLSNTQAGLVSGMLYFGTMVGSPLMGVISDFLRRRKVPMLVGIVCSILMIELCLHLHTGVSLWVWCLVFFCLGVTASAQVLAYPIVAESNPHYLTSTATSIVSMQMLLGGAISEPLFGYILDSSGGARSPAAYHLAIGILPLAFILAFIVCLFIRETQARRS